MVLFFVVGIILEIGICYEWELVWFIVLEVIEFRNMVLVFGKGFCYFMVED